MFLARSRARRQRFQQSRSLSVNKTLEEPEPVPAVTAKRGTFKHFAQSLARFQSLRARRLTNPGDPSLGPLPPAAPPCPPRAQPPGPPFRLYSASSRDEKTPDGGTTVCGYSAAHLQTALVVVMVTVTCTALLSYSSLVRMRSTRPRPSQDGHWRSPPAETLRPCSIDRKYAQELGDDAAFRAQFRFRRPVVVTYDGGAAEWTLPEVWTRPRLLADHGATRVRAGRSDDMVRRDVTGNRVMTLEEFVTGFIDGAEDQPEPLYVFDRDFLEVSGLRKDLKIPSFLTIPGESYDLVTSLGSRRSGLAFHQGADAWTGVLHGAARVFLYPRDHTPPGGSWGDYSALQWYDLVYKQLEDSRLPLECVLDAGDILYVPEGMYMQIMLLTDTVMVGATSRTLHGQELRLIHTANENERHIVHDDIKEEDEAVLLMENVRIYQKLLSMIPDNADVHMRLGAAYRQSGELGDAERHTRHATSMDAYHVTAFLNLAQIHNQLGNIAEADRNYQMALRLNPAAWGSHLRYSEFLTSHSRVMDAISVLRQGVLLRPDLTILRERLRSLETLVRVANSKDGKDIDANSRNLQGG